MPDATSPFLDLFRRRLVSLHGELRAIADFQIVADRGEIGIELHRGRLFARALLLAAPLELIRRTAAATGSAPRWLAPRTPPIDVPSRLFRTEPDSLPAGLAARAVVACGGADDLHWLSRWSDPSTAGVEWLLVSGPGAAKLSAEHPLGELSPFPATGIVPVELGPSPCWDRDLADHRFLEPRAEVWARTRPPVAVVGPEVAPGLGFEGEVLLARRVALQLADRLGAKRGLG